MLFRALPLALAFLCFASAHAQTTRITVSNKVLRPAASFEPLGVNNLGDAGGTRHGAGNLIRMHAFEPIRMRELKRVIETGSDEHGDWVRVDGHGTSHWLQYGSGAYSGATLRAYRFTDAKGRDLPIGADNIIDLTDAEQCKPLFTGQILPSGSPGLPRGGWLADAPETFDEWNALSPEAKADMENTWRIYYSRPKGAPALRIDDVIIAERSFPWPDPQDFHPRTTRQAPHFDWELRVGDARIVATPPGTPAEVRAYDGVLRLTPDPDTGTAAAWYKLAGGIEREDAFWYGTLDAGVKYRYEAWVKAPEGSKFTLTFGELAPDKYADGYFGHQISHTADGNGQWQKVGFTFTAPEPGVDGIYGATLLYEGTEPALVDNVRLQPVYSEADAEADDVIHRPLFEALLENQPADGRKGVARLWVGLNSASMASILRGTPDSELTLGVPLGIKPASDYELPHALKLLEATGDSPETRMSPWIITQVTHSEEEHAALIEYLAAPYKPEAGDTPEKRPWAYLRTLQRANNTPWTDTFREILIEFGNENWHNRVMSHWIGFGRAGAVHQGGKEYGLWAGHMIKTLRALPFDSPKITYTLGGNYDAGVTSDGRVTGYGQEATVAARGLNNYHSHATYIGPRWEVGEASQTTIDDPGVQKTLLSHRVGNAPEWEQQAAAHRRLRELGFDVKLSAYEGGPSGFGLRAQSPEEDRAGEYYGKSVAMGTAILDAWINAWNLGWTHQAYLGFGQGRWWSSHTSRSQGHRPSPGWLAQTLINRYVANADLLEVSVKDAPVREAEYAVKPGAPAGKRELPMIYAHATSRPGRLSLVVVNLDLEKPANFEARLPIRSAKKITLHTFTGDPRDTNLDERKVELAATEISTNRLRNGVFEDTIPPGKPAVFVFEL